MLMVLNDTVGFLEFVDVSHTQALKPKLRDREFDVEVENYI